MRILVAGDYVPRNRLTTLIVEGDYDSIFGSVKAIVRSADYSIVNFESPIAEEGDTPIPKCGQTLCCNARAVDAIKYAGFKCATLANNHLRDWGDAAVERTIQTLRKQGLDYVGAGSDLFDAEKVLYHQYNGEMLAVINCCENEFSIASKGHYGANPLNPIKQYYDILEARMRADFVLVVVHGGHEHYQLPSPRMQDTYRFFVDAGADMVVNHHQHCYGGYEIYKGKPIIYGTGNFCMDIAPTRIGQKWNYGYMVMVNTSKPELMEIIPYEQCGEFPTIRLLNTNAFYEDIEMLNSIIANRSLLEEKTDDYYSKECTHINNIMEPIQNRFIAGLQKRHLLPSLISKKWLLKMQDFILCEAHRDKMDYFFKSKG